MRHISPPWARPLCAATLDSQRRRGKHAALVNFVTPTRSAAKDPHEKIQSLRHRPRCRRCRPGLHLRPGFLLHRAQRQRPDHFRIAQPARGHVAALARHRAAQVRRWRHHELWRGRPRLRQGNRHLGQILFSQRPARQGRQKENRSPQYSRARQKERAPRRRLRARHPGQGRRHSHEGRAHRAACPTGCGISSRQRVTRQAPGNRLRAMRQPVFFMPASLENRSRPLQER